MNRTTIGLATFLTFVGILALANAPGSKEHRQTFSQAADVPYYVFRIDFPTWTRHGVQLDTTFTLPNLGDIPLDYVLTSEEVTGPPGWLTFSGGTGEIPVGGTEDIALHLNTDGIVNDPGTAVTLVGRLIMTHNQPSSPDTFSIRLWVLDTLISPELDTIATNSVALVYSSNGNSGQMGMGSVNMDFTSSGQECDPAANIYLFDGSPMIGWLDDTGAVFNSSFYGRTFYDPNGFIPLGNGGQCVHLGQYWIANSGTFLTHDSSIAISRILVGSSLPANGNFLIQCLRIRATDGQTHTGLTIADAMDWDIPSDSESANTGGYDFVRNLVYQQGVELNHPSEDSVECQQNDARFGGVAFIESFLNGVPHSTVPYSGYIAENDGFLYALANFDPQQLWNEVHLPGLRTTDSVEDLHTVICYEPNFTLQAGDVLEIYSTLVVLKDGTFDDFLTEVDRAWALFSAANVHRMLADDDQNGLVDVCESWYCCTMRGDINGDGSIDIGDVVCLAEHMFCPFPETELCCHPTCDDNADLDGSGAVDISDLVYFADYMFGTGTAPPAPCY